ncbi:MAG: hypothetical protein ACRC4M_03355 [Mycoplasma sp.]
MIVQNTKEKLFEIFETEILSIFSMKEICEKLSLHSGTIKRWILKKEVPTNYFNLINKFLSNKYKVELTEIETFKTMDQFFTKPEVAKDLILKTIDFIKTNYDLNIQDYTLIEPSAGSGSFYFNFPRGFNKIGLDLSPQNNLIKQSDWLEYQPTTLKNIVIGNPPFGLRGNLALQFINHAAKFSDFVAFILPPLFNSNGKGSPMLRVDSNMKLVKEITIDNKFEYPNGQEIEVNSIFQIWTKLDSDKVQPLNKTKMNSEYIKVYSLSDGGTPASRRNVDKIGKCDFYLPSKTFNEIELHNEFKSLPHNRGYGIVILKDPTKIRKLMQTIDWSKVSFKSTNGANNLRSDLICKKIENEVNSN